MEGGITGDLSVMDIILYRMIVQRRVASSSNRCTGREKVHSTTTTTPTNPVEEEVEEEEEEVRKIRSSWIRRKLQSFVGEEIEEDVGRNGHTRWATIEVLVVLLGFTESYNKIY
jgi:hypothetical protein